MRYQFGLLLVIVGLAGAPAVASAVDITACGQVVPRGEVGVVLADLDCPTVPAVCANNASVSCTVAADCPRSTCVSTAVLVQRRATLNLNGHTLKGGGRATVTCASDCTITGPGQIENPPIFESPFGIYGLGRGTFSDIVIDGGFAGIYSDVRHLRFTVTNVVANNAFAYGIAVMGKLRVSNVTTNNSGSYGIAFTARLTGDTITANGNGGDGIGLLDLSGVTNLTAMNNSGRGISGRRVRLANATITGNGLYDIVSSVHPRLTGVVCEKSARTNPDVGIVGTWRVCAND